MSKIFSISELPVSKAFPSLEFGKNNCVEKPSECINSVVKKTDVYIKKNVSNKRFLKQFFSRIKH